MIDSKFASFEVKIKKQVDTKIIMLEKLEMTIEEIEKQIQENKQSTQEGNADNIQNCI